MQSEVKPVVYAFSCRTVWDKDNKCPNAGGWAGLDGLAFYGHVLPVIKEVFQESTVNINIHFLRVEDVSLFRYVVIIDLGGISVNGS